MPDANRVTFHHEGAGNPTDRVSRFLDTDNYSIGIGITRYEVRRSPRESFTTKGQGGVRSLQVCFSGDRRFYLLRDEDLTLARQAIADARSRGWISDNPDVFLHGDTDKGTECPGNHVKTRRADLIAASKKSSPAPAPKVRPMYDPPLQVVATTPCPIGDGVWGWAPDNGLLAFHAPFDDRAQLNNKPWFVGRHVARVEGPDAPGKWFTIVATSGERYTLPA